MTEVQVHIPADVPGVPAGSPTTTTTPQSPTTPTQRTAGECVLIISRGLCQRSDVTAILVRAHQATWQVRLVPGPNTTPVNRPLYHTGPDQQPYARRPPEISHGPPRGSIPPGARLVQQQQHHQQPPPLRRIDSRSGGLAAPPRYAPAPPGVIRPGQQWLHPGNAPRPQQVRPPPQQVPQIRPVIRAQAPYPPQHLVARPEDALSPGMGVEGSRPQTRPYIAAGKAGLLQEEDARTPISVISRGIEGLQPHIVEQGKPKPRLLSIIKGKLYSLEGKPGLIQHPKQLSQPAAFRTPDFPAQSPAYNFQRVDVSDKMDHQVSDAARPPLADKTEVGLDGRPASGLAADKPGAEAPREAPPSRGKLESPLPAGSDREPAADKQEHVKDVAGASARKVDDAKPEREKDDKPFAKDDVKTSSPLPGTKEEQEFKPEQVSAQGKVSASLPQDPQDKPTEAGVTSGKKAAEETDQGGADPAVGKHVQEVTSSDREKISVNGIKEDAPTHSVKDTLPLSNGLHTASPGKDSAVITGQSFEKPELKSTNGDHLVNGHIIDEAHDEVKLPKDVLTRKDQPELSDSLVKGTEENGVSKSPDVLHSPKTVNGSAAGVDVSKIPSPDIQTKPNGIEAAELNELKSDSTTLELEDRAGKSAESHEPEVWEAPPTPDKRAPAGKVSTKGEPSGSEDTTGKDGPVSSATKEVAGPTASRTPESVDADEPHSTGTPVPEGKVGSGLDGAGAGSPAGQTEHQESQGKTKTAADQKPVIFESKFSEDLRFEARPTEAVIPATRPGSSESSRQADGQVAPEEGRASPAVSETPSPKPPALGRETSAARLEEAVVVASKTSKSPSPDPAHDGPQVQEETSKSPVTNGGVAAPGQHPSADDDEADKKPEAASAVDGKTDHDPEVKDGTPTKKQEETQLTEKKAGDHDSEVDDSPRREPPTTNGDIGTPQKSPSKIPGVKKTGASSPSKSPVKSNTSSSKSSTKTPPEQAPVPEKRKVPMNKVQVGGAPSPNLKTVRSKIGSLENTSYKPGGGKVKIENRKLDFSKTQPKIAAKNDAYVPGGGDKKITQVKLQWNAKPKVGSLDNATHKPGGGDKKIETVKLDFKDKAKPKIGSKDNVKYQPGGGAVKNSSPTEGGMSTDIEEQKLDIKAQSKVGSLANVKHKPGGGEKKIFDDKDYLKQVKTGSLASSEGRASGAQSPEPSSPSHHSSQPNVSVSEEPQAEES